jgi:serine/threonine protein kinase
MKHNELALRSNKRVELRKKFMNLENLVGQVLDEKYKIERELGRGGMGAVYLSTHVGTERPVAVKVIVPEFMQRAEFVERFRREARAAGRLRHPNVVDVTDFGFADTPDGRVAYLVMEYLDGCTLGEILEEEKKLPLSWTLDILEQVSSAIHEAHGQGIIHRDLKPDNIWLEPNQRGGYTVKVLDFGIAKLETAAAAESIDSQIDISIPPNSPARRAFAQKTTIQDETGGQTMSDNSGGATSAGENQTITEASRLNTLAAEAGTLIQSPVDSEAGTAILPLPAQMQTVRQESEAGTKLISEQIETEGGVALKKSSTAELTRVGAVLGTPLYMSPEQCRGEKLTAQSDVYSLGVIAYQMLSGKTPFSGDFMDVMKAHKETPPPALDAKKVGKRVKKVIHSALSKNPADRPATAQAFASQLRAHSEGIGVLLQRALVIYSQHLPKFLLLALLIYSPFALNTFLQVTVNFLEVSNLISNTAVNISKGAFAVSSFFLSFFCGYLILGTTAWLVTQILATPLRPVLLRPAFKEVISKWKKLAFTGTLSSGLCLLGYALCFFPGLILSVLWALVAPVVMMENLRGRAALRRSKQLTMRSLKTTAAAVFIMFLVPMLVGGLVGFVAAVSVKALSDDPPVKIEKTETEKQAAPDAPVTEETGITIKTNNNPVVRFDDPPKGKNDMRSRVQAAVRETLMQIIMLPVTILFTSFSAIVIALLYLKTRQAGGESMQELLAQLSDEDQPEKNWQKRVHERLLQSGRISTSKSDSMKNRKQTTEG